MPHIAETDQTSIAPIAAMRRAYDLIRRALGVTDLPAAWICVLLLVAEQEAQPLSWIERESGLSLSTVQRTLLALGSTDRYGKPGLDLIERISDPRHATKKIYFLTPSGKALIAKVVTVLTGDQAAAFDKPTAKEYLARFEAEQKSGEKFLDVKAFSPQVVATGKRSLRRSGQSVGPHVVTFPLAPAKTMLKEIDRWLEMNGGGQIYILDKISKPEGMVMVDLPSAEAQVWFILRWYGPVED